jgi:transketolase
METLNKEIRRKILEKGHQNNISHYGSALSCVDAIKYLYDNVLDKEDVFILSKGHGAMALYAVLEEHGKNPIWKLHPELDEKNGLYATSGSLGHGLPIATGRAFAKKLKGEKGRVYVLTGDGEMEEGSNWEALMIANSLDININLLVDFNKYQSLGKVQDIMNMNEKSLERKLKSFGFKTKIINGHDPEELKKLGRLKYGRNAVILDTIKGKGVSSLERDCPHTYNWKDEEEYLRALKELE